MFALQIASMETGTRGVTCGGVIPKPQRAVKPVRSVVPRRTCGGVIPKPQRAVKPVRSQANTSQSTLNFTRFIFNFLAFSMACANEYLNKNSYCRTLTQSATQVQPFVFYFSFDE